MSVIRLPRQGGRAEIYRPDSLTPTGWTAATSFPALTGTIGADLDQRVVFATDDKGGLFGLDLESRAVRSYLDGTRMVSIGPDGSIFAFQAERAVVQLARRVAIPYRPSLAGEPIALAGMLSDRVATITRRGDSTWLQVLSQDRASDPTLLPHGALAVSAWGDLVAVASDTALVLTDPDGRVPSRSTRIGAGTTAVTFSPSGHRIYLARDAQGLSVFDRYSLKELGPITLPGPARTLRPDATGRWMLVQPTEGDSAWIVDLPTGVRTATVRTSWAPDLPLIAGAGTLMLREGSQDVVAYDLNRSPPAESGRVVGGSADLWLAIQWVPREQELTLRAAADSALVAQDSALLEVARATPAAENTAEVFLQVSSSQNPEWARELARQIGSTGFPASVTPPTGDGVGYRVIVGPYTNREEAEEAGRQLGRPYFILLRPASRP